MSNAKTVFKDPNDTIDFGVDLTEWLEDGETIVSAAWTLDAGLTEASETFTDTRATVWVTGGTAGTIYKATARITTSIGRTIDETLFVEVKSR